MMYILALSDLHGYLPEIPKCDLLLLGGDYCPTRSLEQQRRFILGDFKDWLKEIPARYIVGIAGNHDFIFQEEPEVNEYLSWKYLKDQMIDIEDIKIYGSPWTVPFHDWAFMKPDYELRQLYKGIPTGLDILLTHGPAYRHLDKVEEGHHVGSLSLWERVKEVKPDSHVCGHIHEARGILDDDKTRFYNVSHVTRQMEPKHLPVHIPLRA